MKRLVILLSLSVIIISCGVSTSPQRATFRQLQSGKLKEDTSYVYALPYASGRTHRVIQGYYSRLTHKERAAIDFNMATGTKIYAARGGVVTRVKKDGTRGGLKAKYRQEGNLIIIDHEDGTRAGYWHLQYNGVLVNVGDTVHQGQHIGYSGNTGYTSMPHLHFLVWQRTPDGRWEQIGTRFKTNKGDVYLRPYKRYKNPFIKP